MESELAALTQTHRGLTGFQPKTTHCLFTWHAPRPALCPQGMVSRKPSPGEPRRQEAGPQTRGASAPSTGGRGPDLPILGGGCRLPPDPSPGPPPAASLCVRARNAPSPSRHPITRQLLATGHPAPVAGARPFQRGGRRALLPQSAGPRGKAAEPAARPTVALVTPAPAFALGGRVHTGLRGLPWRHGPRWSGHGPGAWHAHRPGPPLHPPRRRTRGHRRPG